MKNQTDNTRPPRETLRGVVVPAQWDNDFQVTDMLIACPEEREVRIGNLESFPMLKQLARNEVELTGVVTSDGAAETIMVDRIQPLEG